MLELAGQRSFLCMGKCLQSQERIMILGTHSILAQPDVRVPLCQGRQLWRHPVPQELQQGGGEGEDQQQPVTACPREVGSICSSSSSGVSRSPSSAAQLSSPHSLRKALPPPPHSMGFQAPLCHPHVIIHFFLPSCCLICSVDSDPSKLTRQPGRLMWLCTRRSCCSDAGLCLPGNRVQITYWKCSWRTSYFGTPYNPWKILNS